MALGFDNGSGYSAQFVNPTEKRSASKKADQQADAGRHFYSFQILLRG
jgi:hypothetical protein